MPLPLPKIIGHRCSRGEGLYENTEESLRETIQHADGIEIDVVRSKDGALFFIHDTYFWGNHIEYELNSRLSEESIAQVHDRRISKMMSEEIKTLELIDGQPLLDLENFIFLIQTIKSDFIVNIELKSMNTYIPMAQAIKELIEKTPLRPHQFIFSSFNYVELKKGQERYPEFPLGILFEPSNTQRTEMYPWRNENVENYGTYTPYRHENLQDLNVQALTPQYICLNEFDLRPTVIDKIHETFPSLPILVWWYYKEAIPKENYQLINTLKLLHKKDQLSYITGIITDYPKAMKQELNKLWKENKWD